MEDMLDYLCDIRQRPVWRPLSDEVKKALTQSDIPLKGQSPFEVYEQVQSIVVPYSIGNVHPRYLGYVKGTGSVIGALAELITGTMNTVAFGGEQASIYLEHQVLSWLKILMGFPNDDTCSGALVSGTSVATIIALAVARNKFCGRQMKVYCSTEVHSCLLRAVKLLGLGQENMITISTNSEKQIDLKALEEAIDTDCCGFVVGSAGTVGTGAIDDLDGLANLCARNADNLWYHVDGAIGAVARCSERLRPLFIGIERADSIAFDLHKWLFVPYECGVILVREGQLHQETLAQPTASYLTRLQGGICSSESRLYISDYVLELSRAMKSLKVWMTLKTYGIETFGRIMEQNVDQAKYFVELIKQHPTTLELLATGSLSIICFRYRSDTLDLPSLNKLNRQLLVTMQERGIAVLSPFVISQDTFALRMCITNHRTKLSDLDLILMKIIEIGHELVETSAFLV